MSLLSRAWVISKPIYTRVFLWSKQHTRDLAIVGVGLVVLYVVHANNTPHTTQPTTKTPTSSSSTSSSSKPQLQKGTPNFEALLPEGKMAEDLGDWTRVSPPNSAAVYAYTDKLEGTEIIVSQQPLPGDFKNDTTEHMQTLANDFNAQKHFTLHGTDVYIGTSTKGPQSVIFTKNKLLILIKSTEKIRDDSWANYIEKLN